MMARIYGRMADDIRARYSAGDYAAVAVMTPEDPAGVLTRMFAALRLPPEDHPPTVILAAMEALFSVPAPATPLGVRLLFYRSLLYRVRADGYAFAPDFVDNPPWTDVGPNMHDVAVCVRVYIRRHQMQGIIDYLTPEIVAVLTPDELSTCVVKQGDFRGLIPAMVPLIATRFEDLTRTARTYVINTVCDDCVLFTQLMDAQPVSLRLTLLRDYPRLLAGASKAAATITLIACVRAEAAEGRRPWLNRVELDAVAAAVTGKALLRIFTMIGGIIDDGSPETRIAGYLYGYVDAIVQLLRAHVDCAPGGPSAEVAALSFAAAARR
jgi:hypothetical protein